jgi:hypothetical protein
LHQALCDKFSEFKGADGQLMRNTGPKHPEMIRLSSLIQESVDFSKHGKAVDPYEWKGLEDKLEGMFPDYQEK